MAVHQLRGGDKTQHVPQQLGGTPAEVLHELGKVTAGCFLSGSGSGLHLATYTQLNMYCSVGVFN